MTRDSRGVHPERQYAGIAKGRVIIAHRAQLAFGDIMDLAVGLGGTITGEHGVGRLKRPWLEGYLGPEAMELNHRIKKALDPDNILNPGAAI